MPSQHRILAGETQHPPLPSRGAGRPERGKGRGGCSLGKTHAHKSWAALLLPLLQLLLLATLLAANPAEAARTVSYAYDKAGNLIEQTDELGHKTTHSYDALGQRTSSSDSLGVIGEWAWDASGNLIEEKNGESEITSHSYDSRNRRTQSSDSLGLIGQWRYNQAGDLTEETDGRGIATTHHHDKLGQRLSSSRDGYAYETLEYDPAGNLLFRSDGKGNKEGWQYDGRNLAIAHNRALAAITSYQYDGMGQLVQERDPEGRITQQTWDQRSRLTSRSTNGGQETTEYEYDGAGNLTKVTHPEGNATETRYNTAHQPKEIEDAAGVAHLAYDAKGQLTSRTDPLGHTTGYTLDARGQRTQVQYPEGSTTGHTWDQAGRLTTTTQNIHGQSVTSTTSYDARSQITQVSYSSLSGADGLSRITNTYDGAGNLTRRTIQDASGTRSETHEWDAYNRLSKTTDAQGTVLAHTYDRAGNNTHTTAPAANGTPGATQVTTYGYDALNRLTQIQAAGHTTTHTYDRSSRITQTTHSGGISTAQSWDGAGRIQSIRHSKAAATLQSSRYQYDKNGRRVEQVQQFGDDSGQAVTTTYQYDQADRLTATSDSQGRSETYTLDAAGNKTRITRSGYESNATASRINTQPNGQSDLSYDSRGQIQSLSTAEYQISYQWDASGHLTQESISGSSQPGQNHSKTYQWNAAGQLIGIQQNATPLASYRYSGQSLRDKTQTATGTSHTVWDGEFAYLLQDEDTNTLTRTERHGLNPIVVHAAGSYREVLLRDGLESITATAQAAGTELQSQSDYDAWGQKAQSGNTASRHGYTGHLHDAESGLIYARARYYNPVLGRFISQDPLEGLLNSPITWNAYVYGNANPLLYWDPTGEAGWLTWLEDLTSSSVESWRQERAMAENNQQTGRAIVFTINQNLASAGHGVAWFLNTTSDLIVRNNELSGHEEAAAALAAKEQTIGQAIEGSASLYDYASNNKAEAAGRALRGVNDWSHGVLTGDAKAWATTTELFSGCLIAPSCMRSLGTATTDGLTAVARAASDIEFRGSSGGYGSPHLQRGAVNVGEGSGLNASARVEAASRVEVQAGPTRTNALPEGELPYQLRLFPDEAYSRTRHYGTTPTAAQRASVPQGMEFDHNPTLVRHYYEGDGVGGLPGFNLTQPERLQHARSLSSGSAATPTAQRTQGAEAARYSKEQKKKWGL